MKLPQANPPEAGNPSGSYLLFEFIPYCPESRDFRFAPTSSGGIQIKNTLERNDINDKDDN
jgi:hypothetical protein